MLTQNAMNGLLKDVTGFIHSCVISPCIIHFFNFLALMQQNNSQIIHQVKQELLAANISITTELAELFSDASNTEPFAGLDTEFLQTKYYKENFRLLVSVVQYIYNTIQLFVSNI